MAKLSEILRERGYVYQHSSKTLEEITDGPKRTVYLGIDPSADSLHVGNLMGLLVLRRFLEDGHQVIILTGGGTGMIGDPGGKSEERNLLDEETVARNAKAVAAQIKKLFDGGEFIEENNAKWLGKLKLLDFLRDIGKHFTVNAMIKKDTVRERLEKESPLSFTEFSYSLLQSYDFLHLNEAHGCDVQVGGSDQWSNILAGVEFIRRTRERTVYALTWPLIVNKTTGKKFGKSEKGAVWLDPKKTSPYEFYQFWFGVEDESVEEYLLKMTMCAKLEIDAVMELQRRNPAARHAQRLLARATTELVHGKEAAQSTERISEVLFGEQGIETLEGAALEMLLAHAPSCEVDAGSALVEVMVRSRLASSKREARQLIESGGVALNGIPLADAQAALAAENFTHGIATLKRGKGAVSLLKLR